MISFPEFAAIVAVGIILILFVASALARWFDFFGPDDGFDDW